MASTDEARATSKSKKPLPIRKPSAKQKRLLELITENHSTPKPMGKLMIEAGYSPQTAVVPSQITESPSFIQLMNQSGLTDEKINQRLNEALDANRVDSIKGESYQTDIPDHSIRLKAIDQVVKLKGHTTEKAQAGNTYNTFIQQNNLDPNAPENKSLVDSMLDNLMDNTKGL